MSDVATKKIVIEHLLSHGPTNIGDLCALFDRDTQQTSNLVARYAASASNPVVRVARGVYAIDGGLL